MGGYVIHICSFTQGVYTVRSPNGGQGLDFEDSDQFGPSKINLRTGDLTEIPDRHKWFWEAYPAWRAMGRPVDGKPITTPLGEVQRAAFPRAA